VPAEQALTVYDALVDAGTDLGLRNAGLGALGSLRLEKAYRDYAVDIDNTDTPLDVGLGFTVAWDKPGGFIGREALLASRHDGPPIRRLVQVLLDDPEPLLHGHEPVLRDGRWAGYVRAGAYGHTLGAAVGLAMLEDQAGLPADALDGTRFEVDVAGTRHPARASIRPLYDPDRRRITA
jgi:glycine cleavage system aminomethyltransferase T